MSGVENIMTHDHIDNRIKTEEERLSEIKEKQMS
jgi:hypothetical protein